MLQSLKNVMGSQMRWYRDGLMGALVVTVILIVPQSVIACPGGEFNPACWVYNTIKGMDFFDFLGDLGKDLSQLTWDVLTLDPIGASEDVFNILENAACFGISPLNWAGGESAKMLTSSTCSFSHPIEQVVLDKLKWYFNSPFDSVRIHGNCWVPGQGDAITFGEHIYFQWADPNTGNLGYHVWSKNSKPSF